MKKRILQLTTIALSVFLLAACTSQENQPKETDAKDRTEVVEGKEEKPLTADYFKTIKLVGLENNPYDEVSYDGQRLKFVYNATKDLSLIYDLQKEKDSENPYQERNKSNDEIIITVTDVLQVDEINQSKIRFYNLDYGFDNVFKRIDGGIIVDKFGYKYKVIE